MSTTITESSSSSTIHNTTTTTIVEEEDIQAFEALNKWKDCTSEWMIVHDAQQAQQPPNSSIVIPPRLVFSHNRTQAANKGFPSVLEKGATLGLSTHETVALYGWTTGDYRFLNHPLVVTARRRGLDDDDDDTRQAVVEFEDYPFLPYDLRKYTFRLFDTDIHPYLRILASALSKLPPLQQPSDMVLWRGHVVVVMGSSSSSSVLPQSIGSRFRLPGYTSATLDREVAVKFCRSKKEQHNNNKNNTTMDHYYYLIGCVSSQTAKSISKWSCRPEEMEVLFGSIDTEFEVVPAPSSSDLEEEEEEEELDTTTCSRRMIRLYVKEVVQQPSG